MVFHSPSQYPNSWDYQLTRKHGLLWLLVSVLKHGVHYFLACGSVVWWDSVHLMEAKKEIEGPNIPSKASHQWPYFLPLDPQYFHGLGTKPLSRRHLGNNPETNCNKTTDLQRSAVLCMLETSLTFLPISNGYSLGHTPLNLSVSSFPLSSCGSTEQWIALQVNDYSGWPDWRGHHDKNRNREMLWGN